MTDITHFVTVLVNIVIFFCFYRYRHRFYYFLTKNNPKKIKKFEKTRNFLEDIVRMCRIRYNKFFTTILLPIISISLLAGYLIYVRVRLEKPLLGFLSIMDSVILTPIFEEIAFRGVLLGMIVIIFSHITFNKLKWKRNKISVASVYVWSLFFVSVIFSFLHQGKLDIRYIGGIIFGALYLIDKKNLLPAMIAHSINNLSVILIPYLLN